MASNIADKTLFDNAFYKTVHQSKGFISNGPELTYVTMTLKNAPRELKRIILRTIRSGNEHMKEGEIEIYEVGDADPDVIEYYFEAVSHSATITSFADDDSTSTFFLRGDGVVARSRTVPCWSTSTGPLPAIHARTTRRR